MKGQPAYFLCPVERRENNDNYYRRKAGYDTTTTRHHKTRTGNTKPAPGRQRHGKLRTSHQYECSCGHTGWTTHRGVLRIGDQP